MIMRMKCVTFVIGGLLVPLFWSCSNHESSDTPSGPPERSMYIWADTFNTFNNADIVDLLLKNSIKNIFLSYSDNTNKEKIKPFISLTHANNISVSFMLGKGSLIFPENSKKLTQILDSAFLYAGGIVCGVHSDIEPQIIPGWDTSKVLYMSYYLTMLRTIRKHCDAAVPLSVSVNPNYPNEFKDSIPLYASQIYNMIFNVKPMAAVCVRLQAVTGINKEATCLAINAAEYDSKQAIAESCLVVHNILGIRNFAIQDLKHFMALTGK
jgi:hypothetical protein